MPDQVLTGISEDEDIVAALAAAKSFMLSQRDHEVAM
jgi:hypothetical protein